ncbi:MAG: 50S ribosomal protein L17 [Bacteroidales bacterium]|nr:50S ribosomal protein L17 [Bacteroidales bacterium]
MRHRKKFNHLGRTSSHRKAMLSNMATSLILHKRITTTTAKAKALRSYVEPLITRSKDDTTHSRRTVFSYLQSKEAVTELFREVATKIAERPGGYTRIIKMGNRLGDNADMCLIELVDYNELLLGGAQEAEKKTAGRRRRRKGTATGKEQQETKPGVPITNNVGKAAPAAEEKPAEDPKSETTAVVQNEAEVIEAKTEIASNEEKSEADNTKADDNEVSEEENTEKKAE